MSELDFVDSGLGTNDDLLHRVRKVLADIYLKALSDMPLGNGLLRNRQMRFDS